VYENIDENELESNNNNCPNDFVEIRDGRYGFSPLIGRFCGMSMPRAVVRAVSGYMWMRFHSDDILEYAGFQAEYDFVRSTTHRFDIGKVVMVMNLWIIPELLEKLK
jgi:hypothetical protein